MRIPTILALAFVAMTAAGCSMYSLEKLRSVTPQGTPFQTALARLYMDFATEEEKEYDWLSSWHFADKGLQAAYGNDVAPEDLAGWDIPASVLPEMQKARETLVATLAAKAKSQPEAAAQAQFNFDCWLEQQDEGWQDEDIARCRDGFSDALVKLGAKSKAKAKASAAPASMPAAAAPVAEKVPEPAAEKPAPKPEEKKADAKPAKKAVDDELAEIAPKPEAKQSVAQPKVDKPKAEKEEKAEKADVPPGGDDVETQAYVVFFEPAKADVTESAQKTIEEIVPSLEGQKSFEVVLNGRSETGAKETNRELSKKRLEAVKERLLKAGIKAESIVVMAGSQPGPAKSGITKRVEIFLGE